jgi:glycosyltransferase 2 family protein
MNDSTSHGSSRQPETAGRWFRILASYLVAAGCLFWVFHDIQWKPFMRSLAHIHWWRMAWSVNLEFLAYFCVAWEWQLLLRPSGSLPLWRTAQAVFAGRFANDALPLHLGYLVRALLAARWMGVGLVAIFPSLIVERLWDGLWLAAAIGLAAICLPLPVPVLRAAEILGALVLAGTAATAFLVLRGESGIQSPAKTNTGWKPVRQVRLAIQRLAGGVRDIVRSGLLPAVLILSLLKLGLQAAAFLGLLWAYGLYLPVPVGLAVFLVGYLGVCVPSTPAGTGMFQLFVVTGLTIFGVGKSVAAGFALVAFVAITAPLAVAGFFALAQSGLRLRQIRVEAAKFKNPGAIFPPQ